MQTEIVSRNVENLCGQYSPREFSAKFILRNTPLKYYILSVDYGKELLNFTPRLSFDEHMKIPQDHDLWGKVHSNLQIHIIYNYWCMENGYLDRLKFSCHAYYHFDCDWVPSEVLIAKALTLQSKPFFQKIMLFAIETVLFWAKDCDDSTVQFSGIENSDFRNLLSTFLPFEGEDSVERVFLCDPESFIGKSEIKDKIKEYY